MGRTGGKPVHLVSVNGQHDMRQALWNVMRELREFGISELEDRTRICEATIHGYVAALAKGKYLERKSDPVLYPPRKGAHIAKARYALINDVGVEAPRLNAKGEVSRQGCGREQMWRTMRILGSFTTQDLAVSATTEECTVNVGSAREFLKYLAKAGYIVQRQRGGAWRLVKNTGPRPPVIQKLPQVFDPNTGKVVWTGKAGAA